jgi:hypothetical protein
MPIPAQLCLVVLFVDLMVVVVVVVKELSWTIPIPEPGIRSITWSPTEQLPCSSLFERMKGMGMATTSYLLPCPAL